MTWDDRTAADAWGSSGGDLGPVEYGTLVSGPGDSTHFSIDRLIQEWADGTREEHGIAVYSSGSSFYRFHTTEATDPGVWPSVFLSYNPLFGLKGQYGLETVELSDRRSAHVNVASGNLTVQELDIDLVGRAGFAAQVSRQYDSRFASRTSGTGGDSFGAWWNVGWNWQLNPSDGTQLMFSASGDAFLVAGAQHQFFYDVPSGGYTSAEGSEMTLEKRSSGEYELRFNRTGEVWTFAPNGYLDSRTDRSGNTITYTYDNGPNFSRLAAMTDSRGQVSNFTFDSNGTFNRDLTGYTDPAGRSYGFTYTGDAEIATFTDPDGNVTTYTYDNDHNLTGIEDAEGNHTLFDYDTDGRVVELVRVDDPVGMTGSTWLFDYSTAWETVVTDPNGHDTTYAFDRQGRITEVEDALGRDRQTSWTASASVASFSDLDGNATINTYSTDARYNLSYGYHDGTGDTALVHVESDGVAGQTFYYTYDQLERLDGMYTSSATVHDYSYDPAGNRLTHNDGGSTTIFSYNAANQLTNAGGVTVSHDGQGNQTATTGGDAYTYDEANRPVSITAGGTGPLAATYRGDTAVGRASLGATSYVTSLLGVTSQTTGASTVGYTRLPDGQVLSRRDGTTVHYLLPDRLGSTQALVDDGGTVTTRYAYSPFGQTSVTAVTAGHVDQPYRFTGQHQDPTGLYRMGLRYYNPDQARWTQPDPALSLAQLPFANTYTYVGENPINGIDPAGASTLGCVVSAGTLALGGVATVVAGFTSGGAALLGGVQLAGGLYGYVESGCS